VESAREPKTYLDVNGETIHNRNKNAILEVAIELFSRSGFSAVSVREITRQVGIKESSLYNHFRSKEEILGTIYCNFRADAAKITPPLENLDAIVAKMEPIDFLRKGFRNFKAHIEDPSMEKIWRIIYMEQVRSRQAREIYQHDIVGKITDFLEIVFAKYAALGRIRPYDPRLMAVNYQYPLFQMIALYVLRRLDGKETDSLEKSMEAHIEFFIDRVRV
jgi:AcrR family transcriptional regulator